MRVIVHSDGTKAQLPADTDLSTPKYQGWKWEGE
jgi:hypothetical protein